MSTTSAKTSVLNIRVEDEIKAMIAGEAIRDGRSMSVIANRALKIGLEAMIAPAPAPAVKAPKAPKAKAKAKAPKAKGKKGDNGDEGAAGALAPAK
jgi:negative regulator of replication initiation